MGRLMIARDNNKMLLKDNNTQYGGVFVNTKLSFGILFGLHVIILSDSPSSMMAYCSDSGWNHHFFLLHRRIALVAAPRLRAHHVGEDRMNLHIKGFFYESFPTCANSCSYDDGW